MKERIIDFLIFIFWLTTVIVYPMLVSIYVTMPLFIGFAGLMLILGIDEGRIWQIILSILYMINLEINLSLPLFLIPTSVAIYMLFFKNKLSLLKLCPICIKIATVIFINIIYFLLLYAYDFVQSQNSVNYDSFLLFTFIYDIIAAVLI